MEPKSYHRDLTDKQWGITMAYLPQQQGPDRPLKWERGEIINAILPVVANGVCGLMIFLLGKRLIIILTNGEKIKGGF